MGFAAVSRLKAPKSEPNRRALHEMVEDLCVRKMNSLVCDYMKEAFVKLK